MTKRREATSPEVEVIDFVGVGVAVGVGALGVGGCSSGGGGGVRNEKVDAVSARISNEVPHFHLTGEPSSRLASVTSQRFPHLGQGLDITIQHRTKKGNWICLVPQQLSRGLFGLHCVERGDDARGMNRP